MENTCYSNDLYHHGTKGMRWGVRRYQNSDGSLTPAGRKRYSKDDGMTNWQRKRYEKQAAKLKKETAKVKEAEEKAAAKKKAQSKFTKLEEKQKALEARKKALKDGKDPEEEKKKEGESLEDKRARLLKSSDAKELYENRHLLSTNELNDRINRIDAEARLQSKIVQEKQKTGKEYFDDAVNVYKTIDHAWNTFSKSTIGKSVLENLGIETKSSKKKFDIKKMWEKVDEMDDDELNKVSSRVEKRNKIKKAYEEEYGSTSSDSDSSGGKTKGEKTKGSKEDNNAGKETVDFTSGSSDRGRSFYNTLQLEDKSRR